jgi:hypothetical protein
MATYSKAYTPIPLEKLDYIRAELHTKLKQLSRSTGERYAIRTFYLGPRATRQRNTTRADATVAKIAIYTYKKSQYSDYSYTTLDRYL